MKFGRHLLQEAYPQYRHFYLAYKDLKQAIKLITGSDASAYTISEVTSNFGNNTAFAGSVFRPPESRFQDLLNSEKEKINKFMEVTLSAVNGALRQVLKDLSRKESDERYIANLDEAETLIDEQADQLIFLESYQRINATGFRKITKKYDKHNKSNSSPWYMTQLAREPFLNADFESPLIYLSACYDQIRKRRNEGKMKQVKKASNLDFVKEEDEFEEHQVDDDPSAASSEQPVQEENGQAEGPPLAAVAKTTTRMSSSSTPRVADVVNQRSAKYLIRPEDIMKLKCLLLKYVPIAALGNIISGAETMTLDSLLNPISHMNPAKKDQRKDQQKSYQCCLYFDTKKFDTYRQMVGSTRKLEAYDPKNRNLAYRLRWIGDNSGEPEKDIIIEKVRLEEPANSVNEWPDEIPDNARGNVPGAIVLKQKHVQSLLNGTFNIQEWLHRKKFPPARAAQLKEILLDAAKSLSDCVPICQVWYQRTSFRLKSEQHDTDVCFHLDDKIQFVSELTKNEHGVIITKREVPEEPFITPYPAAKGEDNIDQLPFGVLSVSFPLDGAFPWSLAAPRLCAEEDDCPNENRHFLASRQTPESVDFPMFIQMITGLTSVTEVWTFTFFLHGFANISRKLSLGLPVPHWYKFLPTADDEDEESEEKKKTERPALTKSQSDFITEDMKAQASMSGARPTTNKEIYASSTGRVDVLRDSPGDRLIRDHEEEFKSAIGASGGIDTRLESAGATAIDILADSHPPGAAPLLPPPRYLDGGKSLKGQSSGFLGLQAPLPVEVSQDHSRGTAGIGLEELSKPLLQGDGNVTVAPMGTSAREITQRQPDGLFHRLSARCQSLCSFMKPTPRPESVPKVVNAAVRVEPKTFFANERTLLQWMNMAVLLATIAITLLNFGTRSARIAGLIMAPMAIFFNIHAYRIYAKRGKALEKKEPIDYVDRTGPFILVVSLVSALSIVVALNIIDHPVQI